MVVNFEKQFLEVSSQHVSSVDSNSGTASIKTSILEQVANNLMNRGLSSLLFEEQLTILTRYVAMNPHRCAQLQQCLFVSVLLECVRQATVQESRLKIMKLLREVTRFLPYYPLGIHNRHYRDLIIPLNDSTEVVLLTLNVLSALTEFHQGQSSAIAADIHRILAKLISFSNEPAIIEKSIRILTNLSKDRFRSRAVIDSETFGSFEKAARNRLLAHFKNFEETSGKSNNHEYQLLYKFSLMDESSRRTMLPEILQSCETFCTGMLSGFGDVMWEWSMFLEVCTKNKTTEEKAIELGLLETSLVIVRYGNRNKLGPLINALKNITARNIVSNIHRIIHVRLIETILERLPLYEMCLTESSGESSGGEELRSLISNIFTLMDNVLHQLPVKRTEQFKNVDIIDEIVELGFLRLEDFVKHPFWKSTRLRNVIFKIRSFINGWSRSDVRNGMKRPKSIVKAIDSCMWSVQ